jgi:hypothetical protein
MKSFLYSLLLVLVVSVSIDLSAQGNVPPPPPQNPGDPVPITGIEYLLLGGGAYGIYRFSKKRNKEQ